MKTTIVTITAATILALTTNVAMAKPAVILPVISHVTVQVTDMQGKPLDGEFTLSDATIGDYDLPAGNTCIQGKTLCWIKNHTTYAKFKYMNQPERTIMYVPSFGKLTVAVDPVK